MKVKVKNSTVFVALVLLFASFFGVCTSAAANIDYDASVPAASGNVNVPTTDILEAYLGKTPDKDELEFFDKISDTGVLETVEIAYNEIINTNKADIEYTDGKLYVTAREYEYVGVNDKEFLWIPKSVTLGNKTVDLLKGENEYVCEIECTEPAAKTNIKINYRADVMISADDVNEILNLYHNTAEYAFNKAKYDAYLIEKKLYDDAKAKYDKYLLDFAEFEKLSEEFNNYDSVTLPNYYDQMAKYQKYENDKKEYDAKMAEYNAYLKEYSKIEKQLNAVKLIDVPMAMGGRTIYGAVMGGAVDIVLGRQGDLIAAGAQPEAVVLAGDATVRVRKLMTEFKACKTDREKYIYYTNNYENFCDSFLDLTQALDILYRNRIVRTGIVVRGKNPQYVLLVAQLALISTALIDGSVRDYNGNIAYTSSWTIDNKTILQILENKVYYVDDDTSTPMDLPPEVKKPDDLVEVNKPSYPERPKNPIEPKPVSNPGNAPAIVANPELSLKQSFLPALCMSLDADYREKLIKAYENSDIPVKRVEVSGNSYALPIVTQLNKEYGAEHIDVTFKSIDGTSETITVDKGSPIVCEMKIASSYTDSLGDTRVLIGWEIEETAVKSNTGVVDLALGFEENTTLVPLYEKYCNITWDINGELYSKKISVLENAVCPVTPTKADKGSMRYEFAGWIDESGKNVGFDIGKPEGDAKYTAAFDEKYIVPYSADGKRGAAIEYETDAVICIATNIRDSEELDISEVVKRTVDKQCGFILKLKYGTLKFTFTEVLTLLNSKARTVNIIYGGNKSRDSYEIVVNDYAGQPVSVGMTIVVKTRAINTENYRLSKLSAQGGKTYVKNVVSDGEITFEAEAGAKYTYRAEYVVSFVPNDLVDFKVSNSSPFSNEDITYEITPKDGVEILEILIEDADGNPVYVDQDGSMKKGKLRIYDKDVNISVYAKYKSYTVTYKSNGKNIYQETVEHGALPTPPTPPKISDDELYSYKFVGWSSELTPVTCDVVYEAIYEKIPLPPKPEVNTELSGEVKTMLYIGIVGIVLFIAFVTILTTFIVKKVKKRKIMRTGVDFYDEYEAEQKLDKAINKFKKLKEQLKFEAKNPVRAWKRLKKSSEKVAKAEKRLKKVIEKRVEKEVKREAKQK